jgi:methyl-accepting chemotaxis protein
VGTTSFFSMKNINDKKVDLLNAFGAADAIMESKFLMKAEAQILMELINSEDLNEIDMYWKQHVEAKDGIGQNLNVVINLLRDDNWGHENKVEKQKYLGELEKMKELYINQIIVLFDEMHTLIKNTGELASIHDKLNTFDHDLDAYISELEINMEKIENDINESIIASAKTNINKTIETAQKSSLVLMLLCIVLSFILALFIANIIIKPIEQLKKIIENLSDGDLKSNLTYESKDEVGIMAKALNKMIERLNEIIAGIMDGAGGIQNASTQINNGAQQISQSSSEAAASVEEISSSVEEMAANIQQNTDNSRETEKIAVEAADTIKKGNDSVQITQKSMNEIAKKITVINDIAFQTNILALNAAVEAARAGEHGKGFAVVAAEVRKLAEHSKIAADEIDSLSENGVRISEEAGKNLIELVPNINKTAALVQEITAASMEQSSGAEQINESIQQLNQVAQQNASASEELAATAEELNSQAVQLREMISYFKL